MCAQRVVGSLTGGATAAALTTHTPLLSRPAKRGARRGWCRSGRGRVDVLRLRGGIHGGGSLVLPACDGQQHGHHVVQPVVHLLQVAAHRAHIRGEGAQDTRLVRLGCGEEEQPQCQQTWGHDGEKSADRRRDMACLVVVVGAWWW